MARLERFEDIDAWRRARKLVKIVYQVTSTGKFARDFGLRDQIRRAAVSILSNIAAVSRLIAGFMKYLHTSLKVGIYPVQTLFLAYKAARDMLKELKSSGTIANFSERSPSWDEFNEFIGTKEATQLAEKYRIV